MIKFLIQSFKIIAVFFIALLVGILLSIPLSMYEFPGDLIPVAASEQVLLTNANYVDVHTGQVKTGQTLHIADGRILSISPQTQSVDNSVRIKDVSGAYIVPGLFDMHVHLHDRKYLGLYLAHGVTTVRNMRGLPMHLRWKKELQTGKWLGSNLFSSSPVLDGEKYAHALHDLA